MTISDSSDTSTAILLQRIELERAGRLEAEQLLEQKSRLLIQTNMDLLRSSIALEKEAQRSKAVFDTAAEGIIIFDDDGSIESLNTAARSIFGLDEGSLEGLNLCRLFPDAAFCQSPEDGCFISGLRELTGENHEVSGRRTDGTTVQLEFVLSSFTHSDRVSHSGIVRDLTRRKTLESRLAQAQKLESVGQLAAGIAHELNTPIQFVGDNTRFLKESFHAIEEILNRIEMLIEQEKSNDAFRDFAKTIQDIYLEYDLPFVRTEIPLAIDQTLQGADNVARIVRAMKVFSHPGTKEFQEVDINACLESTLTVSRNEWKYCAKVETIFSPQLPRLFCLPGELNQAFLNLIVNGAHAIQAKKKDTQGLITITTRLEGNNILIDIQDSGTGIPESIRNRIFDPFFTTKGVGKGTGQGLSICYNIIVEMHKGSITFDSVENVGSTFHVSLPLNLRNSPKVMQE
jgi:PAS domain S-box-containing protein